MRPRIFIRGCVGPFLRWPRFFAHAPFFTRNRFLEDVQKVPEGLSVHQMRGDNNSQPVAHRQLHSYSLFCRIFWYRARINAYQVLPLYGKDGEIRPVRFHVSQFPFSIRYLLFGLFHFYLWKYDFVEKKNMGKIGPHRDCLRSSNSVDVQVTNLSINQWIKW